MIPENVSMVEHVELGNVYVSLDSQAQAVTKPSENVMTDHVKIMQNVSVLILASNVNV